MGNLNSVKVAFLIEGQTVWLHAKASYVPTHLVSVAICYQQEGKAYLYFTSPNTPFENALLRFLYRSLLYTLTYCVQSVLLTGLFCGKGATVLRVMSLIVDQYDQ